MNYVQGLKFRRDELKAVKDELEAKLKPVLKEYDAIMNLLKVVESEKYVQNDYPLKGKLQDKVLFAVNELKKATAHQVIDFMRQHESDISESSVVVTCSKLFKTGILQKDNDKGRESIYTIKL
jgi:hypothetical protein